MTMRYQIAAVTCAVLGVALLGTAGCASTAGRGATGPDALAGVPLSAGFAFDRQSALVSRVKTVPQGLLRQLQAADGRADYASYTPTPEQMKVIAQCLGELPTLHRQVLGDRLCGFYFVEHFARGARASFDVEPGGLRRTSYIVCNPQVLDANVTDWLGYQEETCFSRGDPWKVTTIDCGTNTPAFLYVLLRETTRVLIHQGVIAGLPFSKAVWHTPVQPFSETDFAARRNVTFWGDGGGPLLPREGCDAVYRELARMPFASLYGSQSEDDDLAEFLTYYHLTQRMQLPYRISVRNDFMKKTFFEYEPMQSPAAIKRFPDMDVFYRESRL